MTRMNRSQFAQAPLVLSILAIASLLAGCNSSTPGTSAAPAISTSGPQPKVVLPEDTYKFGTMEMGQTRQHVFIIKNEGAAPLKLVKGKATCKCTKFELDKDEIPPGEEARAEVAWKPVEVQSAFRQSAPITTNDPAMPEFRFVIEGEVVQILSILPSQTWQLGQLREGEPTKFTGTIASSLLDAFTITSIESSDPHLTVETAPLDQEELKTLNVKSGYRVSASVEGTQVGEFDGKITFAVDARPDQKFEIELKGNRAGPLRIIGSHWYSERMALDLGTFDAKKGAKNVLTMFITGGPDDLQILESTSSSEDLKLAITPETDFKGKAKKFLISIEVPPGAPPAAHSKGNAVVLKVKTNHPEMQEFKMRVYYVSI
jgi:hypothetical protein